MNNKNEFPEEVVGYFRDLEIRPSSYRSLDDVRRKFKILAIKYHPDKSDSPTATEQFQNINRAYEKLTRFLQIREKKTNSIRKKVVNFGYDSLNLESRKSVNSENIVIKKLPSQNYIEKFIHLCNSKYGSPKVVQDGVKYSDQFKCNSPEQRETIFGNIFITVYNSGTIMCQGQACLLWHACHLPEIMDDVVNLLNTPQTDTKELMLTHSKHEIGVQASMNDGSSFVQQDEKESTEILLDNQPEPLLHENVPIPNLTFILSRIDKLESSMVDLFGVLSADKVNLVRQSSNQEIEVLKEKHKLCINQLNNEIKMKDHELTKLKGEVAELRKLIRKKDDDTKLVTLNKDKELSELRGNVSDLNRKCTNMEDNVEFWKVRALEGESRVAELVGGHDNMKSKSGTKERVTSSSSISVIKSHQKLFSTGVSSIRNEGDKAKLALVDAGEGNGEVSSGSESGSESGSKSGSECASLSVNTEGKTAERRPIMEQEVWKVVPKSKFKSPDVLIVGNSNVRRLSPRFLNPFFTVKHLLKDKSMCGAVEFLKTTDIKPQKYIVIQALDNDICNVKNTEIIARIHDILRICKTKFPDVKICIMEPLGRCCSVKPHLYWDNASRLCEILTNVGGIIVVRIPPRLKKADSTLFEHEPSGYIHLNDEGIRVLTEVYRNNLLVSVAGGSTRNQESSDRQDSDGRGKDRFGLLVNCLIESLSSFR